MQWSISHVEEGAYSILGHRQGSDVPLSTRNGNELVCVPDDNITWSIEPRGSAYVSVSTHYRPDCLFIYLLRIGNIVNAATAIHLTQRPQHVS